MNNDSKTLTRSTSNRMLAGMCSGLGAYLGIDPTIVRLLTVLAFFTGFGGIALVYLIMAIIVPEQTPAALLGALRRFEKLPRGHAWFGYWPSTLEDRRVRRARG